MEMIFKNSLGTVRMDGGRGDAPFKILGTEGLGFVRQNEVTATYPFLSGQKTLIRTPGERLVTVSLESAESGVSYEGKIAAMTHETGQLEIRHGSRSVYADCYISNMSVTRAVGGEFEKYVLQFTCDYPYFRDSSPTVTGLFEREKLIKGKFALPMVFSRRVAGGSMTVTGDREVYPYITVGGLSYDKEFPLEIVNETTGAALKLTLPEGEYEMIVFDLRNGRVYCGQNELTKYLDEECFMSDFYLAKGENKVEIKAMDVSVNTMASVSFENEYFAAWEDRDA